ncbi:MAG: type II toxin-antitoxin system VapC family toxin [Aggregatilineales bacterium]
MSYLLDTHTFLWFLEDDVSLSDTAKTMIEAPDNDIYLSIASVWEIAIKVSLNKLQFPSPFKETIDRSLFDNQITLLNITTTHTDKLITLPFHHRDPFDRLIIVQSQIEALPVIGKDTIFDKYDIERYW